MKEFHENPNVVIFFETKSASCDRRFIGIVWKIRNKEWVVLPTYGA